MRSGIPERVSAPQHSGGVNSVFYRAASFRELVTRFAKECGGDKGLTGALMGGRFEDDRQLVRPVHEHRGLDPDLNDFDYRADPAGERTSCCAHVRKTNLWAGWPEPHWAQIRASMMNSILASATLHRTDRLFPGNIEQFEVDESCFGYDGYDTVGLRLTRIISIASMFFLVEGILQGNGGNRS